MDDKIRILAVDDEPDLRTLLKILLTNRGYEVLEAASGDEAVEQMQKNPGVDLVIMDVMMPGLSGVEACAKIRSFSPVPMLFLTAKTQITDKVEAFDAGGDDYLAKPFSQSELMARVESLTRRYRVYKGKREDAGGERLYVDDQSGVVRVNGKDVDLTDKEYAILLFFYRHRGQILDVETVYEGGMGREVPALIQ